METFADKIKTAVSHISEKEKKNYKIDSSIRLYEKLALTKKNDFGKDFDELLAIIRDSETLEKQKLKLYRKRFNKLAADVRKNYGFTEKGYIQGTAMGLGVGIGVAVGAALQTINIAFIGAGIAVGVAVGLAIGAKQEKDAELKGKVY